MQQKLLIVLLIGIIFSLDRVDGKGGKFLNFLKKAAKVGAKVGMAALGDEGEIEAFERLDTETQHAILAEALENM
uniref:Uncharacterized protein n=1 Tax=Ciona intestinalis TaxID=7719 RepID=H2XPU9_CIOIN